MFSLLLIKFSAFLSVLSLPLKDDEPVCGYESCHPTKDGFINVHIVPHTHDDVGWLKTFDQYYYGSKTNIQRAGVQYILDTVVTSLEKNPERRFMYIETAFFWKWWLEQDDETRNLVKRLINSGRLELNGGGWSMNDEGAVNYQSVIDQMTWGLRMLNDTFGECGRPRAGWQIDPFGHSKTMANIFALLGYDAFFLNRIDYQDFNHRRDIKTLETIWRTSANAGPESDIFNVVLPKHYNPPPGFCFDIICSDDPIIDDPESPDYNVQQRVDDFISFVDNMMVGQSTSNVLITMGDDFTYQSAETWYLNLDKLIKYTNARQENGSNYNLIYSTASCYVKAVYDESKENNITYPVKHDDFFPYTGGEHDFFTGYFTSRPTQKRFEREGNNFLQICKQLSALTSVNPNENVDILKEAMGVMQHHDAISGTEKQAVAEDYNRMLAFGMTLCEEVAANSLSVLSNSTSDINIKESDQFSTCRLLNISQCALSESEESFQITVYNPLSKTVNKVVRLPVLGTNYIVRNSDGEEIVTQITPIPEPVQNIPGRESTAENDLIFVATEIPPLGFETFFVERTEGNKVLKPSKKASKNIKVDKKTGLISIDQVNLYQWFGYYKGFVSTDDNPGTISGAYIFRPDGPRIDVDLEGENILYDGPILTEIHQTINDYISQVFRYYNSVSEPFFELNWLVGPIPDDGVHGKEIVSIISTDFSTNSTFYTDSNGREMLKRVKDYRPTWDVHLYENISGNYYPITSRIVLKSEDDNEFSILTDRSEAGSSINDGEIELMLHRVCLGYDAVGENLNEQAFGKGIVARGTHYISFKNSSVPGKSAGAIQRDVAQRKLLDSWIFLSPTNGKTFEELQKDKILKFAGLKRSLPDNVQLLTLEPWRESTFLIRLEHIIEENVDPNLSVPVTVDLNDLFTTFNITSIRETTLGADRWLDETHRLFFDEGGDLEDLKSNKDPRDLKKDANKSKQESTKIEDDIENLLINLNPMEIRTFLVQVESIPYTAECKFKKSEEEECCHKNAEEL